MAREELDAKTLRGRMVGVGALIGGGVTFVMVGILDDLLKIALGAVVGGGFGLVVWTQAIRKRRERRQVDLSEHTNAELVVKAHRLGVTRADQMNKAELTAAIAAAENSAPDDTGDLLIGTADMVREKVGETLGHMREKVKTHQAEASPDGSQTGKDTSKNGD